MSDYVRNKGVYYPISKEEIEALNYRFVPYYQNETNDKIAKDVFDLQFVFPGLFGDSFCKPNNFMADALYDGSHANYYLVYLLYHTYGYEYKDFGRSRGLTLREQEKYRKIFENIIPNVDQTKFRYLDVCYYNCCECDDYYVKDEEKDDFYKEI